ncbi:uncharacterized protein [Typha angustifolia]|uniref:uncharacterized protein isoform X1 n=2 Tax=Typha angustifolia TaxID=59011 RepID=UPI003C2CD244
MSSNPNGDLSVDVQEVLQVGVMHGERLQLDRNAPSRACQKDKIYAAKLELELQKCLQEIEFLQDQLNLRTVEANFMGEHVHSLELKLIEYEKLHAKLKLMGEELVQSDTQNLLLMGELRNKEEELHKSALQIQKLETLVLDSQCEIESLKLDLTALEQRCCEEETFAQQAAQEKERMNAQLRRSEFQLREAEQVISRMEGKNRQLKQLLTERDPIRFFSALEEQLDKLLIDGNKTCKIDQAFFLELKKEFPLPSEMCNWEESLGPILSKLVAVSSCDQHIKEETEKMANHIEESELLVKQLKEELRDEKRKAKEEAEDLTQEMAELRYQITGMLEEEYRRRACIEQASIQRIQELEAQVLKEQKKSTAALKRFEEAHELAERQSLEIKKLKNALESFHSARNQGAAQRSESCVREICSISPGSSDCLVGAPVDSEALDANCIERRSGQALVEWHPVKDSTVRQGPNIGD